MNELNEDTRARYGVEAGWWFATTFQTRWSDLDPFGHVNNGAYLVWCEETRNAYFQALGVPNFTADAPGPVLKDVGFTYDRSLLHGEKILVTARVAWVRNTSFRMEFAVWNGSRVGHGHALCVWLVNDTGERVTVPDHLRSKMVEVDGCELLSATST
ncbi:putative thioesterase [Pseudomonas sp. GM78]|uniref:acyl-CoA thioesterase n=1 Tax=Pseudomonas sp. GM78 TaxID=1144337 RepID=UPI000270B207|nr:acyl-CoA thioesterase [Pseudomonas sp. GM78]EJN26864.1 putative thioesterase [Pseudomonas sp. GM78]